MTSELSFSINMCISQIHGVHLFGYSFMIIDGFVVGDSNDESLIHPLYLDLKDALDRVQSDNQPKSTVNLGHELLQYYDGDDQLPDSCFHLTFNTDPFMAFHNIATVIDRDTVGIAFRNGRKSSVIDTKISRHALEVSLIKEVCVCV